MNLRLGKIKVPRRFIVVNSEVYELDGNGELYYIPESDVVLEDKESRVELKAGEYLKVSYVGKLTKHLNFSAVVSPAKKGDYVLIANGGEPRVAEVQSVDEHDWSIECYKATGRVKYGHYSLIVDIKDESEEVKALEYLFNGGEDVAMSLTYKVHEELRSDLPNYNKVNDMVKLIEYFRELK